MLQALVRIADVAPTFIDEVATPTYTTIAQQLTANPKLARRWEVLANYPWPVNMVPQVADLLETHITEVPEGVLDDALDQLIKLPSEQAVPDVLADRLVVRTEKDPTSRSSGVAAALWSRLSQQHQMRVAHAAATRHRGVGQRVASAPIDVAAAIVANASETASAMLDLRADRNDVAKMVLEGVAEGRAVTPLAAAAAVEALDPQQRPECATSLWQRLPAQMSTSKQIVSTLVLLRSAGVGMERDLQDAKTAELLSEADEELAAGLGVLAREVRLPATDALLDGRDGLRKSHPSVIDAFDGARATKSRGSSRK